MNRINNKLLLAVAITLALSNTVMAEDTKTKDPLTGPVANARQEAQIWTTYALNPYLSATDLNVSVQQGVVTLSGNVADDVHKELAGAIAADDEDLLPPLNGQIDGPHGEAALPLIVKAHLLQLDALPGAGHFRGGAGRNGQGSVLLAGQGW